MNNYKKRSHKYSYLKREALRPKPLPLNKDIQNILSLFKNTSLKEKNSEILYNVLKNKEGLKNLNLNIPSYPVADSTKMEGDIANREVNTIKDLNIIELQDQTRLEDPICSSSVSDSDSENIGNDYKNYSLNSLYLTELLSNNLIQDNPIKTSMTKTNSNSKRVKKLRYQTLLPYLNSLTQFNKKLAKHQHLFYQFNKANNNSFRFLFNRTSKLLNLTFLAMGCLMSKPNYKVIYTKNDLEFEHDTSHLILPSQATTQFSPELLASTQAMQGEGSEAIVDRGVLSKNFTTKILIDLSYFIRKNKHKYLYNNVEVNDNIIHISHPDNLNSELSDCANNQIRVSQRNNILCKYNDRFQNLTDYLNSIFKSEVELNLVRLHKVYYDSQILVQDIALKSYKFRFVKLVSRLFRRVHIQKLGYSNSLNKHEGLSLAAAPSYLSGLNIKLAGRTFRQRVVPRMTVKRIQKASLTNVNVQYIDRARFTGKTRRGAFSFTITLGHVFK